MEELGISIPLNKPIVSGFYGPVFLLLLKDVQVFLPKLQV